MSKLVFCPVSLWFLSDVDQIWKILVGICWKKWETLNWVISINFNLILKEILDSRIEGRFCFVCFVSMDAFPKEVGIPLGILPHVREQNKHSYFHRPGQSYHRSCRISDPAPGSTPSSHVDPGRLEFSLPPEEPRCAHGPWSNPRYSTDPLQAISSL